MLTLLNIAQYYKNLLFAFNETVCINYKTIKLIFSFFHKNKQR